MTYDVTAHPLLSDDAKQLSGGTLEAQADAAEADLDAALTDRGYEALTDGAFTTGSIEHTRATLAVVHQVNYRIEAGIKADVVGTEQRGERQMSYRGGVLNPFPVINPRAMALALTLVSAASSTDWPTAGALR